MKNFLAWVIAGAIWDLALYVYAPSVSVGLVRSGAVYALLAVGAVVTRLWIES